MQGRTRPAARLVSAFATLLIVAPLGVAPAYAEDDPIATEDLTDLSLADLMEIEVTSVSKRAQRRTDAAAAITVITNEDIRRSGMTTVPEVLRLVPGLEVARVDANRWAISSRGFNSSFANKLLVMIDGRSVYTPLFGGTYWDAQDYPLEDIDRIEVIRGPGGVMWGANAVNGIINVITKNAKDTRGGLVSGYGGNYEYGGTGRYGIGIEKIDFRVYVRGFKFSDFDVDGAKDGQDQWWNVRTGFRLDASPTESDKVTVSADLYDIHYHQGALSLAPPGFERKKYEVHGENMLVKWRHEFSKVQTLSFKSYYDHTDRQAEITEDRDTYDVELQYDQTLSENLLGIGEQMSFSVGGDYRASADEIETTPTTGFDPTDETIHLVDFFLQGQMDLFDRKVSLIAGSKLGWNSMSEFEYQPSGRAIWNFLEGHSVWGAVSRAVRLPTRSDHDLATQVGPIFISGNNDVKSEKLLSFELGYRFFAIQNFTADVSSFYNEYDTLASLITNPNPPGGLLFDDGGKAKTYGVEVELNYKPVDWWRLTAGYAFLTVDSKLQSGSVAFGAKSDDSSPKNQVKLRSQIDLPYDVEFDTFFQYVEKLSQVTPSALIRNEKVPALYRLDFRLGWKPQDWLELSFAAQNVLDRRHYEYSDTAFNEATKVPRTYYGKATVTF